MDSTVLGFSVLSVAGFVTAIYWRFSNKVDKISNKVDERISEIKNDISMLREEIAGKIASLNTDIKWIKRILEVNNNDEKENR